MMNSKFDLFCDFAALSDFRHAGVIILWRMEWKNNLPVQKYMRRNPPKHYGISWWIQILIWLVIFATLRDFRHTGVIIWWRMGVERIMCETKHIWDKNPPNAKEFHDEFKFWFVWWFCRRWTPRVCGWVEGGWEGGVLDFSPPPLSHPTLNL